jgi:hydrogenase maturation protease
VIGVGNTLMGDDGVGVLVARELEALLPDTGPVGPICVIEGDTAGMALMPYVLESERVIFVDAFNVGDDPGSVYRMDPDAAGLTTLRSNTSHGVGIPYLITLARLQGHWPEFIVYGVQVCDIMCGPDTLSDEVRAVVPDVVDMVVTDVLAGSVA